MGKIKGLTIKCEWMYQLERLSPKDFMLLVVAMFHYRCDGIEPTQLNGDMAAIGNQMLKSIKRSLQNEKSGKQGGNPKLKVEGQRQKKTTEASTLPLFLRFWNAYPKKVGKLAAERKFRELKVDEPLLSKMLLAIEAQKKSPQWIEDKGRFIPNPTTWLNQGRWDDEIEPSLKPVTNFYNRKGLIL